MHIEASGERLECLFFGMDKYFLPVVSPTSEGGQVHCQPGDNLINATYVEHVARFTRATSFPLKVLRLGRLFEIEQNFCHRRCECNV